MEVDALETIITWLESALMSVGGRVAAKHRYGAGWTEAQAGVQIRLDGGPFDQYAPVTNPRMEMRIFANDQVTISNIFKEFNGLCRANERFVVGVSGDHDVLVHYVKPQSLLSFLYDDALRKDYGLVFIECMIGEEYV